MAVTLDDVVRTFIEQPPCVAMGGDDLAAMKEVGEVHPACHLDGLVVPAEFDWLVVNAHGTMRYLPSGDAVGRVSICVAVDRAGDTAALMLTPDGVSTEVPGAGDLLALMRSCLSVPTAPTTPTQEGR